MCDKSGKFPDVLHQSTAEQVLAIMGLFAWYGMLDAACLVGVAFHAMLRTAEALNIRCIHLAFADGKVSLSLTGKSGNRFGHAESVVIEDELCILLLRFCCRGKQPLDLLFSGPPSAFRRLWKWEVEHLRLDSAELTLEQHQIQFVWASALKLKLRPIARLQLTLDLRM